MLLDGSFFFCCFFLSFFVWLSGCLSLLEFHQMVSIRWLVGSRFKTKRKKKNNLQPSTSKNCIANFQYPLPVNNYCSINTDLSSCSDVSIESQLLKCTRMLMLYHVTGV